jgi:5-methylcytosine-specific restriction endonuclease McrA
MTRTKQCSECKEIKAVAEFYKHPTSKDGLGYICKLCARASNARWYKEHPEQCRALNARWRKEHPEQKRANNARWYKEHSEKVRANSALWYKEHPEQKRASSANWRKAHPEQCRALNARWNKERPEKGRTYSARRRTLKRGLPATLTNKEWQRILIKAGNCCTYCDCKFSSKLKAVQDHFIPLSKGGPYTKENIVPACQSCNSRKGNRLFKDIHEARKYLKKE